MVAPRAKAVVVREHMRRKGRAMLGGARDESTGDLIDNVGRKYGGWSRPLHDRYMTGRLTDSLTDSLIC